MKVPVYSSNNEQGLLKSMGPYRVPTVAVPKTVLKVPDTMILAAPVTVGTSKVYGITNPPSRSIP